MLRVGQYELRSEGGRLVYSRLVGGKGWDGIGEGWDWWVLDRQIEEPLWHGGGRECGTGKGATRGKGVGPTR